MEYKEKCTVKRSLRMSLPVFSGEGTNEMNSFCRLIEEEAEKFTCSEEFPQGSLYTVRFSVSDKKEPVLTIDLAMRTQNGSVRKRRIVSRWRHGFICNMTTQDI